MKKTFKVLGILFAVATVVMGLLLLIKDYNVNDQGIRSWSIIVMCGGLIFNGVFYYLDNKNKRGIMMALVGFVILTLALITFPF
jgi:CDP-diglyceride synthetase